MAPRKPGPNASSSDDLSQARSLSHALQQSPSPGPSPSRGPYVSFPSGVRAPAASSTPLLTRRKPLEAPRAAFGATAWDALLEACTKATTAEVAFLMNPQGLIVAARGPGDELEAFGARLMVVFAAADKLDARHRGAMLSMTLECARGTIVGLRLGQADEALTLGLSISTGLTAERQGKLVQLLSAETSPGAADGLANQRDRDVLLTASGEKRGHASSGV